MTDVKQTAERISTERLADFLWQEICELPDRSSPEDYPDMGLVTRDELLGILEIWQSREASRHADAHEGGEGPPVVHRPDDLPMDCWKGWDLCAQAHILAWRNERRAPLNPRKETAGVKPLEWSSAGPTTQAAETILGWYHIDRRWNMETPPVWYWKRSGGWLSACETEDEAKAAAQADYEQRILSALSVNPQSGSDKP